MGIILFIGSVAMATSAFEAYFAMLVANSLITTELESKMFL